MSGDRMHLDQIAGNLAAYGSQARSDFADLQRAVLEGDGAVDALREL